MHLIEFSFEAGQKWKPVRKPMNPMFNLKTLKSFVPIFNERAANLVQELKKEINQPHFDMLHYSSVCTLNAVCSESLK